MRQPGENEVRPSRKRMVGMQLAFVGVMRCASEIADVSKSRTRMANWAIDARVVEQTRGYVVALFKICPTRIRLHQRAHVR